VSKQYDGGPAFPQHGWSSSPEVLKRMEGQGGMTLRDWFAGQALVGLLAHNENGLLPSRKLADYTYQLADAMLEAGKEGKL